MLEATRTIAAGRAAFRAHPWLRTVTGVSRSAPSASAPDRAYARRVLVQRGRPSARSTTRVLLWCGVWAGPAFGLVSTIDGALRAGYNPRRHPISCLALGPRGWVQTANFAVTGILTVAGAAGLSTAPDPRTRSRTVPSLIAVAGVGLMASGMFPTDPVNGYPPGTPDHGTPATATSVKHNLAAVPILVGLPAAALLSAQASRRGQARGWAAFSAATAVSAAVNVVLASAGFAGSQRLAHRAGLHQRAAIGALFGWIAAACLRALRRTR